MGAWIRSGNEPSTTVAHVAAQGPYLARARCAAEPSHVTVDPRTGVVLKGAPDGEGRLVLDQEHDGQTTHWVGDRRHWTEMPPKPNE
jgi:hypothetical protein